MNMEASMEMRMEMGLAFCARQSVLQLGLSRRSVFDRSKMHFRGAPSY